MDILTILATIGVIIGIVAGLVQVIEYLQKRRHRWADETTETVTQLKHRTEQSDGSDLAHLRQQFTVFFNESELRSLSFDLGVDYESLSGDGKDDKARELVAYMERNGRLPELLSAGKKCDHVPNGMKRHKYYILVRQKSHTICRDDKNL